MVSTLTMISFKVLGRSSKTSKIKLNHSMELRPITITKICLNKLLETMSQLHFKNRWRNSRKPQMLSISNTSYRDWKKKLISTFTIQTFLRKIKILLLQTTLPRLSIMPDKIITSFSECC